jgi:hypothetical protein
MWATMQTQDVTLHGVSQTVIGPGAKSMFKTIANDQSLTEAAATPKPGTPSPTAAPLQIGSVAIHVENGTTTDHRAATIAQELIDQGFSKATDSGPGTPGTATTSLTYPAGDQAKAQAVAKAFGLPSTALKQGAESRIVLLIGNDWQTGTTFPGSKTSPAPVDTQAALDGSNNQIGTAKGCAQVSTYKDVIGLDANGKPTSSDHPVSSTSPTRAYQLAPNVKDSDE